MFRQAFCVKAGGASNILQMSVYLTKPVPLTAKLNELTDKGIS